MSGKEIRREKCPKPREKEAKYNREEKSATPRKRFFGVFAIRTNLEQRKKKGQKNKNKNKGYGMTR